MSETRQEERHILCELNAKPAHASEVKALLLQLVDPSRKQEGNLAYNVFQDRDEASRFYIVDAWASEATYQAHHSSSHVAHIVEQMKPFLIGKYTENVAVRLSE
ncbi:putative quinol monooxygenase [Granulicella cerasi]|uniref:Quinol monooxygenase n=1 Tax=Granulicella cerasi TaxID=741063 RepID=A0ABW1ZDF8_9BACT|nr:putative quinol monooxygenase [Granulicella cerasi]